MKGLFIAAALGAAALLPATAGAVPPGNTSVPLGSTAACFVVATPAAPATCNFIGAGSSDVGYGGIGTGDFTITHQRKVVDCGADNTVAGYKLVTAQDDSGSMAPAGSQTTFTSGIVYTATVTGAGFFAIGGQGTPGPDAAADPAVPTATNYAGAEDATGGAKVGDAC